MCYTIIVGKVKLMEDSELDLALKDWLKSRPASNSTPEELVDQFFDIRTLLDQVQIDVTIHTPIPDSSTERELP